MNDENDFEVFSTEKLVDVTPVNEEIEPTNPWLKPISLITWGFALTSFTLNFFLLQYILPTLGVMLMYLGFLSLRKVNQWFFVAWIIVIIKLIWQSAYLIVNATPINILYKNNMVIGTVVIIIQLALLFVFRKALSTVFRQSGITPARDPILAPIIWTILIAVCALTPLAYIWIVYIPIIFFYIIMIRSLYKIGDDLSCVAHAFVNAPVKLSNKIALWGYMIWCLILVMISCIYVNHIALDESEQALISDSDTRAELMELGFPKDILNVISDKDISMLSGAIHVEYSSESLAFDPVQVTSKTGPNIYTTRSKPGDCNLQASTVYIEFPDNLLYVLVHFDWMDSKAYWQDGFTIMGEEGFELLNGVLLFKKDGVDYTAPIPRLKCELVTSYSMFGANESRQISGAVSYPYGSEHQRGYVFYRLQIQNERWVGSNILNYLHYSHPFQFPYDETEKRILNGNIFNDNMKQHHTNFKLQAYRDANE